MNRIANWNLPGVLLLASGMMLFGLAPPAISNAGAETAKAAIGENQVEIVNPKCPVMGTAMEKMVPEKMTRMFKGQRYGFCCEVCLGKWDKMTDAEREPIAKQAMGENLVEIVNPKCPVMGTAMEKTAPEKMTRMYKAQRYGFCCPVCLGKWDKMTDAEREPFAKAAMGENLVEIANPICPVMGTDMEKTAPEKMTRMYKGTRLGFCCEVCLGKWDKMTDAERAPIAKEAMQAASK